MNDADAAAISEYVAGMWPSYTMTAERLSVIKLMFGDNPQDDVRRAFHTWATKNPDSRYPKFKEIEALLFQWGNQRREQNNTGWTVAEETWLANIIAAYHRRGVDAPPTDYIIRKFMDREPPTMDKREDVIERLKGMGAKPPNEIAAIQQQHNAHYLAARAKAAEGKK